jgi:hypothetical protein
MFTLLDSDITRWYYHAKFTLDAFSREILFLRKRTISRGQCD